MAGVSTAIGTAAATLSRVNATSAPDEPVPPTCPCPDGTRRGDQEGSDVDARLSTTGTLRPLPRQVPTATPPDAAAPAAAPAPTQPGPTEDPQWYKDAVVYELHVKAFSDSNGDGIGDLRGLTQKLDYLADLGVNTIWLLPFYPSPFRDDGYDVAEYLDIHPAYGTLEDFRQFVEQAHARGLRVITELVVNHTSDQHPWFQRARLAPKGSPERDYYVWSDDPTLFSGTRIIFTDTEDSNWTWDEVAGQYYWHRFFSHQPDLNFDNPIVRAEVLRTLRFWLDLGVDGFRLDAIPYLIERDGTTNENLRETHEVIKELRRGLDASYEGRMFLAEANMWPEDVREYFGDGDECHMAYHFPLMPRMYMAIAQEDRHPVVEILQQTPDIPASCQWAIFLRNHDELTLEMVTSRERDYMWSTYAADTRARINVGIRRRLAPLLDNDAERIKLMNSLLLSMPGSPFIYYGDEIGMGDNFYLGDRDGVRTPMQWTPDRNGGFSRADPQGLYLPAIQDPVYGYAAINVEAQLREPGSLLNWTRRMLAVRKTTQAFGRGTFTLLQPGNRKILAYVREHDDDVILCVANVSRAAQPVELDLSTWVGRVPVEMLGRTAFPTIGDRPYQLTLPGHGFFWFRLATDVPAPEWHEVRPTLETMPVLVLFDGWSSLFRERVAPWRAGMAERLSSRFERELVPAFLTRQRWFPAGPDPVDRVRIVEHGVLTSGGTSWLLGIGAVTRAGQPERYFLPLSLAWEDRDPERVSQLGTGAVARVRQQAEVGLMGDAVADAAYYRALVEAIAAGASVKSDGAGRFRFVPSPLLAELMPELPDDLSPVRLPGLGSNSNAILGYALFLKTFRRLRPGLSPEVEVGRFLTESAGFDRIVPVLGHVEYVDKQGRVTTLALLQSYVPNQGDAWTFVVDTLTRGLEDSLTGTAIAPAPAPGVRPVLPSDEPAPPAGELAALAATLGRRTAQLHAALAGATGDPAFDPEPVTADDIARWVSRAAEEARDTLTLLSGDSIPGEAAPAAAGLVAAGSRLLEWIADAASVPPTGLRTRIHGSFQLDQVLVVENDFVIMDLEGDQDGAPEQARAKHSPLRDVARLLHSLNHARNRAVARASQHEGDDERLAPGATLWLEEMREAFLAGYADEAQVQGTIPDHDTFQSQLPLVQLFEAQRALVEIRSHLATRPDIAAAAAHWLVAVVGAPQPPDEPPEQ